MPRKKAARKYQLTINNPVEHGFSHDVIKNQISYFSSCFYWCLSDEIGENSTLHTHVYLAFRNAVEFDTIQKHFYGAHIENAQGSHTENRDYILKQGKWADDPKHETSIEGTFEESGPVPEERSKKETQSKEVLNMIYDGCDNEEIVKAFPSQINHLKNIDMFRETITSKRYKDTFRELTVCYIWGKTGVGKTRSVMEKYGYSNVYRVTDYAHPFDGYDGQDVILFDEFRSDLPVKDMLKYLDGYPLSLPCRYNNKTACYTKVYVISNIPFEEQYPNVKNEEPETIAALRRRFDSGGIMEKLANE